MLENAAKSRFCLQTAFPPDSRSSAMGSKRCEEDLNSNLASPVLVPKKKVKKAKQEEETRPVDQVVAQLAVRKERSRTPVVICLMCDGNNKDSMTYINFHF